MDGNAAEHIERFFGVKLPVRLAGKSSLPPLSTPASTSRQPKATNHQP